VYEIGKFILIGSNELVQIDQQILTKRSKYVSKVVGNV
jgi:hypothetical protein